MTEDQLKKLRAYYHSLRGIQRLFDEEGSRSTNIDIAPVSMLDDEIKRLEADFPGLVRPFDIRSHRRMQFGTTTSVALPGLRSYLATVIGRLEVEIESGETTPVTEQREFAFVKDSALRRVIERDYLEIQKAFVATCWKSVIILSGGAIEAILTDLLLQNTSAARVASKAPKRSDITKWDLADLINVSVELKLVTAGIERLSHSVREYRNLVHPGNEIRNRLDFDAEEARIALEVLHILHRDLRK